MKRLVVPQFATEAEEAQWWYDHREELDQDFMERMEKGAIHRGGPAALLRENKRLELWIPNRDFERLEKLTDRRDFYTIRECINALLHEALDREEEKEQRKAG